MKSRIHAALVSLLVAASQIPAAATAIDHSINVARLTADSTVRRGGSGGSAYNLSCPSGQVLIGMNAAAAGCVDRVQGICRGISAAGDWTSTGSTTDAAGGFTGVQYARKCASGIAVSGFSGRAGLVIERLVLECARLGHAGTLDTSAARVLLDKIGGSGGTALSLSSCTRPARAIVGRAGGFVDSIELACEDNTPSLSTAEIDEALGAATSLLRTDNGTGDVPADVRLLREGRVAIEPSNGLYQISSQGELLAACALSGYAVVTQTINYCGGTGTYGGCAGPGCMVVIRHAASERGRLWAHEFGHTRGLPNRSGSTLLMDPGLRGVYINSAERSLFESPLMAVTNTFLPAESTSTTSDPVPLQEFISRTYLHGIPLAEATAYGAAAIPELVAVLRDPRREAHWSNAAVTLGMIGEPAAVDAVISFIRDPGAGEVTTERSWAQGNAVVALGYAANRGSPAALRCLAEGLEPATWSRRGLRGVKGPKAAEPGDEAEDASELLRESAAAGLALSGRPEASVALKERLRSPSLSPGQRHVLQAQLAEHGKVASQGLGRYDREVRAKAEERCRGPPADRP